MSVIGREQDMANAEKKTVDLFFGALFRLGVWTGDWETWYGTRPLAPWVRGSRPTIHPSRGATSQRPAR